MAKNFLGIVLIAAIAVGFISFRATSSLPLVGKWDAEKEILKKVVSTGKSRPDTVMIKGQSWFFSDKEFAKTGFKELIITRPKKNKSGQLLSDTTLYKQVGDKITFQNGTYYTIKTLTNKSLIIYEKDDTQGKNIETWTYFKK